MDILSGAIKISAYWMRGGTSKGLFFDEIDLPADPVERDQLLLAAMGSPDRSGMQLNGLGGGISSTSKVVLLKKSQYPGFDIDYRFGQVSLREAKIDWSGSCINLASAIGLYCFDKQWVEPRSKGSSMIRIWQANLNHEIRLTISPADSSLISIPGVPGKSTAIDVELINPNSQSSILFANKPQHEIALTCGKKIGATLILGANPTVFVRAEDLGLLGTALPTELNFHVLEKEIKNIGQYAAQRMKIPYSPALRVAFLSAPSNYTTSDGVDIKKEEADIASLISTESRIHHAHTASGALNLACAAKIPGTIPYQLIQRAARKNDGHDKIRIAHPLGVIEVNAKAEWDQTQKQWRMLSAGLMRTARILMKGDVFL